MSAAEMFTSLNDERLLVITPPPMPSESLRGYILRVSEINGYVNPGDVLRLSGRDENEVRSSRIGVSALQAILGAGHKALVDIGYTEAELQKKRIYKLGKVTVHSMHLQTKSSHICPECIKRSGYIHAFYDLRYAVACPIHGRETIKECPACNRSLKPSRPGLLTCSCGHDLSEVRGELVQDKGVLGLMTVLWNRLALDTDLSKAPHEAGLPVAELEKMDISVLLGLVMRLGRAGERISRAYEDVGQIVEAAGMALEDWPRGLYRYLEIFHGRSGTEQASLGFSIQFRSFYNTIYKSRLPHDQVRFIGDAFTVFGNEVWRKAASRRGAIGNSQFAGVTETANYMGVQPGTVRRLVQERIIKPIATSPTRGGMLFELGSNLPRRIAEGRSLGAREAARWLELPVAVLYALREMGMFRVRYLGDKVASFHEYDVQAFHERLIAAGNAIGVEFASTESLITLQEAMKLKTGGAGSKALIVRAILDGSVEYGAPETGSYAGIELRHADVRRIVGYGQEHVDGYVTKENAAALIGCGFNVIKSLVETGYLKSKEGMRSLRVCVDSIESFTEQYTSCATIAEKHHTSTLRVQKMCGLPQVSRTPS